MAQQGLAGRASAGRVALKEAAQGYQGTRVAQAVGGRRRIRGERAAVSERRQTERRKGAAEGGSEHEGGSLGNVSTIGKENGERSAPTSSEGEAAASTLGSGASARSAEGEASANTTGSGASAKRAKQTRTIRCRRISRSSVRGAPFQTFLPGLMLVGEPDQNVQL